MWDLYLGLAVMAGLSLLVFRLTAAICQRLSRLQTNLLAIAIVAAMILFARVGWQNTLLSNWLPFSNLVIVGNWFPLFLLALTGVVMSMHQLAWWRKGLVVGALGASSVYALVLPLFGTPPECGSRWTAARECQQTTGFTCSAASAATLLEAHGIPATEREMAELCLTRRGTSWLGLYRGLKLKTAGTKWDVELIRCSADELWRYVDRPVIADVGLKDDQPVDAMFRAEYGWAPGTRHSVVLTECSPSHTKIVDPAPHIGHETWDNNQLHLLWRGYGMKLVERQ
jgi:hypothetical protein